MIDARAAGTQQPLYAAMTAVGAAFLFKVSKTPQGEWLAHGVKPFTLVPSPGEKTAGTTARARAPIWRAASCGWSTRRAAAWALTGSPSRPGWRATHWTCRCGAALEGAAASSTAQRACLLFAVRPSAQAIRKGTFKLEPAALDLTYWVPMLENKPLIRQCADLGQAVGMARC
jgi:hypothetical protein